MKEDYILKMAKYGNIEASNLIIKLYFPAVYYYSLLKNNNINVALDDTAKAFNFLFKNLPYVKTNNLFQFLTIFNFSNNKRFLGKYLEKNNINLSEKSQNILKIIEQLPENYKLPFLLSELECNKNENIANILNMEISDVENFIYKSKKILERKSSYLKNEKDLKNALMEFACRKEYIINFIEFNDKQKNENIFSAYLKFLFNIIILSIFITFIINLIVYFNYYNFFAIVINISVYFCLSIIILFMIIKILLLYFVLLYFKNKIL